MLPADTGLADPRAYVRLAAIVRQQIIDGTLEPGQPAPSITRLS
jgi:DNA-binding transcriptional regulator YhcF (GntR family)